MWQDVLYNDGFSFQMAGGLGNEEYKFLDSSLLCLVSQNRLYRRNNGIKHFRSAPYHPSTNGAIQRFVQTFERSPYEEPSYL